ERHRICEADDSPFARAIDRGGGETHDAEQRRGIDDRPTALLDHAWNLIFQSIENAPEVDLHQQGEIRIFKILHGRSLARYTGIVEGDLDSAISLIGLLVEPLHGAAVADVNLTEFECAADTLD